MLEGDWALVGRTIAFALAATVTLIALMGVLFLDPSRALLQAAVLALELAILWRMAQWHAALPAQPGTDHPG